MANDTKKSRKIALTLCNLHLAFSARMWYNKYVKGRGAAMPTLQGSKKFLRNFQKPLDKSAKVWYNIYTEARKEG